MFDALKFYIDAADTYLSLGRYDKALNAISSGEEVEHTTKRRIEYLNLIKAECYIKQTKPQYEGASMVLQNILHKNPSDYHVRYIARLYQLLLKSKYCTSQDVIELGIALKEFKRRS